MAKEALNKETLQEIFQATPHILHFPQKKKWIDYDEEADVLYISFKRPQQATDTKMMENGILLRFRGEALVGITILDVSKR